MKTLLEFSFKRNEFNSVANNAIHNLSLQIAQAQEIYIMKHISLTTFCNEDWVFKILI